MFDSNGHTTQRTESTQVVIVGGGPIGLEVASTLQQRGIDYVVIEKGEIGHTMSWWAPQTKWFSSNERIAISGVPLVTPDGSKASREQYLAYLRAVVTGLNLNVRTFEQVTDLQRDDAGFLVTTEKSGRRQTLQAEAVVLAIGGTDFPNQLDVPGANLPHVDGYLREPHRYFGRDVLIIGGRNSAIEAALRCHHAGARVSLSYRQDDLPRKSIKYWLTPEIDGLIKSGRVQAFFGTNVQRIDATHVTLAHADGKTTEVKADDVLALIGYQQDKTLLERAGVDLVGRTGQPAYDEESMETNVPGLYIAGTAIAGTQDSKYSVFLENCHDHATKISDHLQGSQAELREVKQPGQHHSPQGLSKQIEMQPES
jgi:thioredoxin reductase (NADPH)